QPPTIQPDTRLVVPTLFLTNDLIASLSKAMIFLSSDYSSSEPHTANQCTTKKRVKDSELFKEKMLLAQAQEVGVVLNDEQYDFLPDSLEETNDCEDLQLQAITLFKADYINAYDSDCDDKSYNKCDLYDKFVPHYNTYHESDIQELQYIENIVSNNEAYDELTSNSNVISYADYMVTIGNDEDNYVYPPVQNNDRIFSVIEQMKTQVEKCNMLNQETQSVNESLTSELE
ncbi:hypothetical protein Tco_1520725, partial [Tanacetum coccineum]